MQHAPAGDAMDLGAWMKLYEPELDQLPRAVLVLSLSPSEEPLMAAPVLLKKWMSQGTSPHEMASYLEEHHPVDDTDSDLQGRRGSTSG
jgi:hypothetical protein